MKKNWLLIGGIVMLLLYVAVLMVSSARKDQPASTGRLAPLHRVNPHRPTIIRPTTSTPARQNCAGLFPGRRPANRVLRPTLEPEKFTGPTRDAYRAVKEIPVTIAQLPCYCHCDEGFGHKSLYSCFEDDHAAHCAVCVNEALLALKLEKEQKLDAGANTRDHRGAIFALNR